MNPTDSNLPEWKARDAWFCVTALVLSQAIILFWLHLAARNSTAFSHWWAMPFGKAVIFLVQDVLWLFLPLWFSRVRAVRDFLKPAGLRRGFTKLGWGAAWVALGIAFVDGYGAAKGWTASARQPQPTFHNLTGPAWWYFILAAILLTPFCEEVATRGFIYRAFRGRYRPLIATVLIICFSAYFHWNSISRSGYTLGCLVTLWVLLCAVRENTGSLWDCLLCHAVYNMAGLHLWTSAVLGLLMLPLLQQPAPPLLKTTDEGPD